VEFLVDPRCDSVDIEASGSSSADAYTTIATGRFTESLREEPGDDVLLTELSGFYLPAEPALHSARIDASCELAVHVRAIVGCISLEPGWRMAHGVKSGGAPPPLAESLTFPGFTEQRVRERTAYADHPLPLEHRIWGPEWGLFLSRGHLEHVPLARIQASGVFARAEALSADLAYLQLTDDPADCLRDDYDDMLDRAREVLAPLLADLSQVVVD
jgi:hypothetical protein